MVVVANHTSFLDVAFMYLATRPQQWLRFMGRESLFDNAHGLVGQILSRVGAFPVKRDSADRTAIKRATRMLKKMCIRDRRYAMPVFLVVVLLVPYVLHFNPIGIYLDVTAGNVFDLLFSFAG